MLEMSIFAFASAYRPTNIGKKGGARTSGSMGVIVKMRRATCNGAIA